jgi:anthranilate phosphoribosyltransferase
VKTLVSFSYVEEFTRVFFYWKNMIEHYTTTEQYMPTMADIPRKHMEVLVADMLAGKIDEGVMEYLLTRFTPDILTTDQLAGCVDGIVNSAAYLIDAEYYDEPVVVPVGTGGDMQSTVNITTMAGFVMAASGECKVALYGNKKASGKFGKMDLLESIGVSIDIDPDAIHENFAECNIAPVYARRAFPNAGNVKGVRDHIGRPTLFNTAFPIASPIIGENVRMFVGVSDPKSMESMARISAKRGTQKSVFVHGVEERIDEVSPGETNFVFQNQDTIDTKTINIRELLQLPEIDFKHLQADKSDEFVSLFLRTLDPDEGDAQLSAIRTIVAANAAVGLFLSGNGEKGIEEELQSLYIHAMDIILSGNAQNTLETLIHT